MVSGMVHPPGKLPLNCLPRIRAPTRSDFTQPGDRPAATTADLTLPPAGTMSCRESTCLLRASLSSKSCPQGSAEPQSQLGGDWGAGLTSEFEGHLSWEEASAGQGSKQAGLSQPGQERQHLGFFSCSVESNSLRPRGHDRLPCPPLYPTLLEFAQTHAHWDSDAI